MSEGDFEGRSWTANPVIYCQSEGRCEFIVGAMYAANLPPCRASPRIIILKKDDYRYVIVPQKINGPIELWR